MKNLIVSITLFLLFNSLKAEPTDFNFREISTSGGYSIDGIKFITQDNYGFIWFGNRLGVYKYNSKKLKKIDLLDEKNNKIKNYICTSLISDKNGKLWLSTSKGLYLFNSTIQSFVYFKYNSISNSKLPYIFDLKTDLKGNLWLTDNKGMGRIDTCRKNIIRNTFIDNPRKIHFDSNNNIWLSDRNGKLFTINVSENKATLFSESKGSEITDILVNGNNVWIGYFKNGLHQFNISGKKIKHYSYQIKSDLNLNKAEIRKIYKDSNDNLWIATYNGLFIENNNNIYHFDAENTTGIPHNSIYSIFEDRNNGIWFGTWTGRVFYLHPANNKFYNFQHTKAPFSLSNNVVSSFAQQNGKIYVGTEAGGLNEFDTISSRFYQVTLDKRLKENINIKCLATDKYGTLWVGTFKYGLWYRKKNQTHFTHVPQGIEDVNQVSDMHIYSIYPCETGVWIVTAYYGINFYNFKDGKISFHRSLFKDLKLNTFLTRSILQDSQDNLWIGGNSGLSKISFKDSVPRVELITNNTIYHAYESSKGDVWFSTHDNGIIIYKPKVNQFINFDANGLLQNQDVYGIIQDKNENYWITSNIGLIMYNNELKTVRHFIENDGIQGNIFNHQAIFKDSKNKLYFGGTNGFSSILPINIKRNNTPPNTIIDRIIINNQKIIHSLNFTSERAAQLHLKTNESSLRIEFVTDNYLLPNKNKFKYKLYPIHNKWIDTSHEGAAVFTNLEGGDYTFEVMAANNDGIWNQIPLKINISKDMPWYKTKLAYLSYVIIAIISILTFLYFNNERHKFINALAIEKLQRENEEQIHQMKLKFFTNISHEFRTPLTLISGPIKALLHNSNLSNKENESLRVASINTDRLLHLVNQTLDFRKIEVTPQKLNVSKVDINDFIKHRIQNFSSAQLDKNIKLEFNHLLQETYIEADEDKLDKIIFNLMSNAFKYTPNNGNIKISINNYNESTHFDNQFKLGNIKQGESAIAIEITNSGESIKEEDFERIFERFKTSENNAKLSTGIGLTICKDFTLLHGGEILLTSNEKIGTKFTLLLPKKQSDTKQILRNKNVKIQDKRYPHLQAKEIIISNDTHKGSSILVVEDNKDLRKYIVGILQPFFKTVEANNGKDALTKLEINHFDLIISDVMMPEINGFDLCKIVKSQMETSHIPILLLTALSSTDNKVTGLKQGADAYLSKPFDDTLLLTQIENLLEQRAKLRASFQKHIVKGEDFDAGNFENYFLSKLDQLIEKHIADEVLSVQFIADNIGLSRSQLHRKLTQLTPYTPTEYIKVYKVKKASSLILKDEQSIEEISFVTGFSSNSYFTKCFKSVYGISPLQWKKEKQFQL